MSSVNWRCQIYHNGNQQTRMIEEKKIYKTMIKKFYQKPEAKIVALHQVNILAGTTPPESGGGDSDPFTPDEKG